MYSAYAAWTVAGALTVLLVLQACILIVTVNRHQQDRIGWEVERMRWHEERMKRFETAIEEREAAANERRDLYDRIAAGSLVEYMQHAREKEQPEPETPGAHTVADGSLARTDAPDRPPREAEIIHGVDLSRTRAIADTL